MEKASIICEIIMVLCFGASWPFNIARAYKARTAKGTSLQFTLFIGVGYIAGILSKVFAWLNTGAGYWNALKILAFVFYFINLAMIIASISIYFRNKKLDAIKEKGEQENK
jgi:H+/Cl- antiporter ClcA